MGPLRPIRERIPDLSPTARPPQQTATSWEVGEEGKVVLTPTFFNEGHGVQLLGAFVSLLELSPWRRNTAQKDHLLPRSPVCPPRACSRSGAAGSPRSLTRESLMLGATWGAFGGWFLLHLLLLEAAGAARRDPAPFPTDSKVRFRVPRASA